MAKICLDVFPADDLGSSVIADVTPAPSLWHLALRAMALCTVAAPMQLLSALSPAVYVDDPWAGAKVDMTRLFAVAAQPSAVLLSDHLEQHVVVGMM